MFPASPGLHQTSVTNRGLPFHTFYRPSEDTFICFMSEFDLAAERYSEDIMEFFAKLNRIGTESVSVPKISMARMLMVHCLSSSQSGDNFRRNSGHD